MWQFATQNGYGIYRSGSQQLYAHRWVYERQIGPIPAGMTLDHTCHTADKACPGGSACPHRACVNPAHMEVISRGANTLRAKSITAANAAKTECMRGHPYDGDNVKIRNDGARVCRTCLRDRKREWARKQAAAKRAAAI